MFRIRLYIFFFGLSIFSNFLDCSDSGTIEPEAETEVEELETWSSLIVTASAYNSLEAQGSGNVKLTAWGDTLKPGLKSIAVSRDLLKKGLTYNTKVKIEGLEGTYVVNDKMHPRWKNKIDIYMGEDQVKALKWGKKKLEICFLVEE